MSNFEFFTDLLASRHSDHPQRGYLAQTALSAIYEGINELAKLGHSFQLIEAKAEGFAEFPKTLYHPEELPITVGSSDEQTKALAQGFAEHPSASGAPKAPEGVAAALPPTISMQIPMPKGEYAPGHVDVLQAVPPGHPDTGVPAVSMPPSEDSGNPIADGKPDAATDQNFKSATDAAPRAWPRWYRDDANPAEPHREIGSVEEAGSLGPSWVPVD